MSNSIHRCPNCNYMLVLLEKRAKYKCAKCGKLFPQKDIETKAFKEWNKQQRKLDRQNIRRKRIKLSEEEKKKRAGEYRKEYYKKNKKKLRELEKKWIANNKGHYNELKRNQYYRDLDISRQRKRISFWRKQQKALALEELEKLTISSFLTSGNK